MKSAGPGPLQAPHRVSRAGGPRSSLHPRVGESLSRVAAAVSVVAGQGQGQGQGLRKSGLLSRGGSDGSGGHRDQSSSAGSGAVSGAEVKLQGYREAIEDLARTLQGGKGQEGDQLIIQGVIGRVCGYVHLGPLVAASWRPCSGRCGGLLPGPAAGAGQRARGEVALLASPPDAQARASHEPARS